MKTNVEEPKVEILQAREACVVNVGWTAHSVPATHRA
jgi:hypothetical protein